MTPAQPPVVRDRSRFRRFWPDKRVALGAAKDDPPGIVTTETLIDDALRARLLKAQIPSKAQA